MAVHQVVSPTTAAISVIISATNKNTSDGGKAVTLPSTIITCRLGIWNCGGRSDEDGILCCNQTLIT